MNHKSPRYIDIHSHLNFAAYDQDREEVIKRALDNGVWMINVGTQRNTSKLAVELAEKYEKGVYATVGLHPIHTDKSFHDEKELGAGNQEFISRSEQYDIMIYHTVASKPKVVGIGECGLDYFRFKNSDLGFKKSEEYKKQEDAFRKQIELAIELDKPLMLHVRNPSMSSGQAGKGISAYKDALLILKSYIVVARQNRAAGGNHKSLRGNFHFFAGNLEEAKEILDAGFNLSFTGVITFARDYDEVIKYAPLDRIMSETDCPYVSPEPYRGKRNEPLYVKEVVKKIAEIRGADFEEVRAALVQNALNFFNL